MVAPLIQAAELAKKLGEDGLILLDASKVFDESECIPGAIRFDLSGVFSDSGARFPNTMPSVKQFETECQNLGINNDSEIVVYDNPKLFNSARVWYMFRAMGHNNVRVLDGGMQAWKRVEAPTEACSEPSKTRGNFKAKQIPKSFRNMPWIHENIVSKKAVLIDARSAGRYNGTEPEPRQGLRSGSIPNSCNLPYADVLEDGLFKSPGELKSMFSDLNADVLPMIFTCGSGVTACILLLAAHLAGFKDLSVYDGSWTEWASLEN